jgi:hypothetical protein
MSYIILRGHWCDIVLNVHAPTEDKIYDKTDRFYKELECVIDKFPKYHMKILLGDFSAKVGREDIFKPTAVNECLHEVRVVNFATPENLSKVQCSHVVIFINLLEYLLTERHTMKLTIL